MWARLLILLLCLTVHADAAFFLPSTFSYTILTPCSATVVLSPGAVSANSLAPSCLANPADTVASNTTWTSSSANYITANAGAATYIASTLSSGVGRDITVQTWSHGGYVYERLDSNGNAVYFKHDASTTNGTLEIGIVTGLGQTTNTGATYYPLYQNTDLIHTFGSGGSACNGNYTKTATDGQHFVFSVIGFTYTVSYTSSGADVPCVSFQDYRQMSNGGVAFASLSTDGFRDITITGISPASLYSSYWINQIDLRDFGLNNATTTGSITASSNCLTVASTTGFKIGQIIAVEIGAESGAGARGTIGVGGQWPSKTYATDAALKADNTQAANTIAWEQDTGLTWSYISAAWTQSFYAGQVAPYYIAKSVPMSLVAQISAIGSCSGANSFTLLNPRTSGSNPGSAANASATATNAHVYVDNELILNDLAQGPRNPPYAAITPSNITLVFPAGTYAFAGYTNIPSSSGWTIAGQGALSTTLYSVKGTFGAGVVGEASSGLTVQNLTLQGNLGLNQFGLNWPTTLVPIPYSTAFSEYDAAGNILTSTFGGTVTQTSALTFYQTSQITFDSSSNQVARNLTINDVFTNAVQCAGSVNCWAYNITVNVNSSRQSYTQWQLEWATDTNGGCQNCTINSVQLVQGFESFSSLGTQWISPTGTNALFSLNNVGGWTISNATLSINNGAVTPAAYYAPGNGLVQIDPNTGSDKISTGGTITNMTITETGFIDSNNDVENGVEISSGPPQMPNITINGLTYTTPNWTSPSTLFGPQAVGDGGTSNSLNNITSCATVATGSTTFTRSSIGMADSSSNSLTNSSANTIYVGTGNTSTGNTHPCP